MRRVQEGVPTFGTDFMRAVSFTAIVSLADSASSCHVTNIASDRIACFAAQGQRRCYGDGLEQAAKRRRQYFAMGVVGTMPHDNWNNIALCLQRNFHRKSITRPSSRHSVPVALN